MTGRARLAVGVASISAAVLAFAFVAAPKSCEWGMEAYFAAGIAALGALFAWSFVAGGGRSVRVRMGLGVVFVLIGASVWLIGLFAANVRLICRLF